MGGTETDITLCAALESLSFQITVLLIPTTTVSVGGSKRMLEFAPTPWGMTIWTPVGEQPESEVAFRGGQ